MKCDLCGNPTGKFFSHYHPECAAAFKKQWALMGKCIDDYNEDLMNLSAAKEQFIRSSAESHAQRLFWSHIYSRSELRTYDKLVFSQNFVCVSEEKNRCHMERTGLSYAKYPQWETNSRRICQNGTIALSDSGVYILGGGEATRYIPYGKIVDVGLNNSSWFGQSAYFDVRTTSSSRHRYSVSALDKKFKNIAVTVYDILRFMVGLKAQEVKTHLINNPPYPMDLMFDLYAPDPVILQHTEVKKQSPSVNVTTATVQTKTVDNGNYQRHRWTMAEDELCCRKYLEWYVVNHSSMDLIQFVRMLEKALPDISAGSLRMKTQNIKQLCIEHGIRDSLDAKPLAQYSRQNAVAFQRAKTELGL